MALREIEFEVIPGEGVQAYWIAVSKDDVLEMAGVDLENRFGSILLESGRGYILFWWFAGNPGNSLKIVGKEGSKEVVKVKNSLIPSEESEGGGRKRFSVE